MKSRTWSFLVEFSRLDYFTAGPQFKHSVHSTSASPKGTTVLKFEMECLVVRVQKVHSSAVGLGSSGFKFRPANRLYLVQSNEMRISVTRLYAVPSITFKIHVKFAHDNHLPNILDKPSTTHSDTAASNVTNSHFTYPNQTFHEHFLHSSLRHDNIKLVTLALRPTAAWTERVLSCFWQNL